MKKRPPFRATTVNLSFFLARTQAFISRIRKSRFSRNVAVVATGNAGAQTIAVAFAPIITRLYGPEAFGMLGMFVAMVGLLTPVAALAYPMAIVLPKEDSEAKGIAQVSVYTTLGVSALVALMLLIGQDLIVELFKIQKIRSFVLLIPLVLLLASWLQINQQWLIRKMQFKITAKVAVLQSLVINGAIAAIGLFRPGATILIVLYVIGNGLHALMLFVGTKKTPQYKQCGENSIQNTPLWLLAKKYYDFPLYRAPQLFINAISTSLPILLLGMFFGPVSAGFFVIAKKVTGLPAVLIGNSVADVFYPRITEAINRDENITSFLITSTSYLAAAAVIPFGILCLFGPSLISFVFGQEWSTAGQYVRGMGLWFFFFLILRPSVSAIPGLKLQGFMLMYEIGATIMRVGAMYIGCSILKRDIYAVIILSIVNVLSYSALFGIVMFKSTKCHTGNR